MIFSNALHILTRFGLSYSFLYFLKKIRLIDELPIRFLLLRQRYYKSISVESQMKELAYFYKNAIKKELNFSEPKSFTEKIQWMKFYCSTKEKALLADKFLSPKIIEKKFNGRIKTIPCLGVWDKASDIDFSTLPDKFVLKCNHGSAMNIIVKDKSKLNIAKARKKLDEWLLIDYAYVNGMFENHYSFIERKIIAEKFIEFIGDRIANTHSIHSAVYSSDWKRLPILFNSDKPYKNDFKRPKKLGEMLTLAHEMSKDYPYARIDFYYINEEIYFGEITFTPDSGIIKFEPRNIDDEWGKLIELPKQESVSLSKRRKRIAWLPHNLAQNRSLREMKKVWAGAGAENVIEAELWKNPREIDYLVLNFYENINRRLGFFLSTYIGKLLRLLKFKAYGIKILWIINNKIPHDEENQEWAVKMMKNLIKLSDRIIIMCNDSLTLLRSLEKNEKKWKDKIVYFPHPNYISAYKAGVPPVIKSDKLKLLFFGSIRPYKNIDILISAFRAINNQNISLTVAGTPKSEAYKTYIENLSKGIPNLTLSLNYIPDDEIMSLIYQNDLLVLPYDDDTTLNSGTVILSCSAKKTFITPNIGTVRDFPDQSQMYIYEYKNQAEHKQKIMEQIKIAYDDFTKDKDIFVKKGEKLYKYIEENHSKERLIEILKKEFDL